MKKILALTILATAAYSLPIDWHGEFHVDTNRIEQFRKIEATQESSTIPTGSQELNLADGDKDSASFQTYIFKLNPELIINDSTTIKGELSTGYGRGGTFGDSQTKRQDTAVSNNTDNTYANALYTYDTSTENGLNVNQIYALLYADTATYKIGRHSTHWGLGALHSSGEKMEDRHATIRDGITVDFKIGNFNISPYYSKISSEGSLTKAARVKESGLSLLYNNMDRELSFGILYAKNKASNFNSLDVDSNSSNTIGKTEVKIVDLYFKKTIGKYTIETEVPMLSGEVGDIYGLDDSTKLKSKAILIHQTYKLNNRHQFSLNAGKVSGDNGSDTSFDAMYLHPNYQIANLLFKYNLYAVSDRDESVYDSYITNTFFLKFSHLFESGQWNWTNSVIWAKAEEVASEGNSFHHHERNTRVSTASANQSDDLGIELDSNFTYKWNTAVTLGGNLGYLFTGDYFAYTNSSEDNTPKNSYVLKAFLNVKF